MPMWFAILVKAVELYCIFWLCVGVRIFWRSIKKEEAEIRSNSIRHPDEY